MELFSFDRVKASNSIEDPDGALWPVNAYSDAFSVIANGYLRATDDSDLERARVSDLSDMLIA